MQSLARKKLKIQQHHTTKRPKKNQADWKTDSEQWSAARPQQPQPQAVAKPAAPRRPTPVRPPPPPPAYVTEEPVIEEEPQPIDIGLEEISTIVNNNKNIPYVKRLLGDPKAYKS